MFPNGDTSDLSTYADKPCVEAANPRKKGVCLRCSEYERGLACPDPIRTPETVQEWVEELRPSRERDLDLERELTLLAAKAAGFTKLDASGKPIGDDRGLSDYADDRAHPGGLRVRNFTQEGREEAADGRNYCTWEIQPIYEGFQAGEPDAAELYYLHMEALRGFLIAYDALRQAQAVKDRASEHGS
jgi:hypothetical protein